MKDAQSRKSSDNVARHYETGQWVRLKIEGPTIVDVSPEEGPARESAGDEWVAPAFWDIQTNGRWGVSFSDSTLTPPQVAAIVKGQADLGSARICPTLISASFNDMKHALSTIAQACETDPDVARMILGIHLEGPSISEVDGYRGVHQRAVIRDPDWDEFAKLQEASGGRIAIVTLAPERTGAIAFIRKLVAQGIVVAVGHTAADGRTIAQAVEAGATLSTHLGNGIAAQIARHPNPIWEQAARDELWASLIADGHHLDPVVIRVLVRAKTADRVVLVSDASWLAGLPPGPYGEWAVDPSGKIVVAGTPYLAGSNQGLDVGLKNVIRHTEVTLPQALAMVTSHPARVLRRPVPKLEPGHPANLVRFRFGGPTSDRPFDLLSTCVDGRWTTSPQAQPAPAPAGLGFRP